MREGWGSRVKLAPNERERRYTRRADLSPEAPQAQIVTPAQGSFPNTGPGETAITLGRLRRSR
jgi:hypothetical protein